MKAEERSMEGRLTASPSSFSLPPSPFDLSLLKTGIFFDELLLAEAGEADEELGAVADALAAQDEAAAVLRVFDVGAGGEAVGR